MAEPGLSELVVHTTRKFMKKFKDNIGNHNAVLKSMQLNGGLDKEDGGRTISCPIYYAENGNFVRFSDAQPIPIGFNTTMSAYEYEWKQWGGSIGITGRDELINSGKEARFKLLKGRLEVLKMTLKNELNADLLSDGTADSGLQIGGAALGIPTDPTSGSIGGIDRSVAANAFARSYKFQTGVDGTGAGSAVNIAEYLTTCLTNTTRGEDRPKIVLHGKSFWGYLSKAARALQRFVEATDPKLGFNNIIYEGVPQVLANGLNFGSQTQLGDTTSLGINTEHTKLVMHRDCDMMALPEMQSFNQYAKVQLVLSMGNMVYGLPAGNFRLFD